MGETERESERVRASCQLFLKCVCYFIHYFTSKFRAHKTNPIKCLNELTGTKPWGLLFSLSRAKRIETLLILNFETLSLGLVRPSVTNSSTCSTVTNTVCFLPQSHVYMYIDFFFWVNSPDELSAVQCVTTATYLCIGFDMDTGG